MDPRLTGLQGRFTRPGVAALQIVASLSRWLQVAAVDESVGPGRTDPPTPRRSWQFGTLLVLKSWLPLDAHIYIFQSFLGRHLHTTVKCANPECLA